MFQIIFETTEGVICFLATVSLGLFIFDILWKRHERKRLEEQDRRFEERGI